MLRFTPSNLRPARVHRVPVALLLLFVASACGDADPTTPAPPNADLMISANVIGTNVDLLTATVSASDIAVPLVFNLPVVDGVGSGTLRIPAGLARTILVQAFESNGAITHEGQVIVDVSPGPNEPIEIALLPRTGEVPIVVTASTHTVEVEAPTDRIPVDVNVQLEATVLDVDGNPVPAVVNWATSNPAIATVDANGLVTGLADGVVEIVASYEGVAGAATIAVGNAVPPVVFEGPAVVLLEGESAVTDLIWPADFCDELCAASLTMFLVEGDFIDGRFNDGELVIFDDQHTPGPGVAGLGFVAFSELIVADGLYSGQGTLLPVDVPPDRVLSCEMEIAIDFNPVDPEGQPAPTGHLSYDCTLTGPDLELEGGASISFDLILQ